MVNNIIIDYLKSQDSRLSLVIDSIGELNISQHSNGFVFIIKEIVGQMISKKVQEIIWGRLVKLCKDEVSANVISNITIDQLSGIGLARTKCIFIKSFAQKVKDNEFDFSLLNNLASDEAINYLTSFKGIGSWTAKMYLIFYLQREDVLPYEDGAFRQAYKWLYNTRITKPESIERRCKKWKPYSSIAARYMYRALDTGLTKIPIKDFLKDEISNNR